MNRQSAGVCEKMKNKNNLTASQRIHAKDLWYLLGIIEGNGWFSCYMEKNLLIPEMVIKLEDTDAKLIYWIKKKLGYGQVRLDNYSNNSNSDIILRKDNPKYIRYIVKSNLRLNQIINWYKEFPPLTQHKIKYIEWIKNCIETNSITPKQKIEDSISKINKINLDKEYIKDWIIGFIETKGSFYFTKKRIEDTEILNSSLDNEEIAEFSISVTNEEKLLIEIGKIIGLSIKSQVLISSNKLCVLSAVTLEDIQRIINFICDGKRVKLKGIKKVKFLLWISKLRTLRKYQSLKIPNKY